jgi:type IV pilus assembly protein PilC
MPLFTYKAKDNKGKILDDVIQADSRKEAAALIRADELQILTIKSLDRSVDSILSRGVSVSDKAAFTRFLSTMLHAGLPLPEALDIIRQETENNKLKKILYDALFHIRKGESLSTVLSKYDDEFDTVFLTMVKAGEESGTLDKSFEYLSRQLLASHELSQKVKSSLMYPSIIVLAMIGDAILMLTFVLPKMSQVFLQLHAKLPPVTKFVLNFGNTVGENLALTLGTFFGGLFTLFVLFYVRRTRKVILKYFLKLPVVNKVMQQLDVARFARTLSTLLKSGVPIMVALDVSSDVLSQPEIREQAEEFSKGVEKGKSLSEILAKGKKLFPVTMIQTIKAGEKTGTLEVVLEEMAAFYESEVDYSLKRATALLEPLLMLIIGVAVGAMVVIMITPIYSIVGGLESGNF